MSGKMNARSEGPACVLRLLARLEGVAESTRAGVALGPYVVDALIDDVARCPALQEDVAPSPRGKGSLAAALDKAQRAANLVRSCPSLQKEWAALQLQVAVDNARQVLAAADTGDGEVNAMVTTVMRAPRCLTCPFAVRDVA